MFGLEYIYGSSIRIIKLTIPDPRLFLWTPNKDSLQLSTYISEKKFVVIKYNIILSQGPLRQQLFLPGNGVFWVRHNTGTDKVVDRNQVFV